MENPLIDMKECLPMKRYGTEAEVSAAVCFHLSPASSYISGHCFRVDGAGTMGFVPALWPLKDGVVNNSDGYQGFHRAKLPKILLQ